MRTIKAPGHPVMPHVSAGTWPEALIWFLRVRRLQQDSGRTFNEAVEQADEEAYAAAHPMPGRKNEKNGVRE